MAAAADDGLAFFKSLSGHLDIELTEKPAPIIEGLYNLAAPPAAKVTSIALRLEVFERDKGEARPLTDEEWNRVVLRAPSIRIRGASEDVVEHQAPNGEWFTVREMAKAIEETERQTRGGSEWFDGIDVHHVFFEGIELEQDGAWLACWGS